MSKSLTLIAASAVFILLVIFVNFQRLSAPPVSAVAEIACSPFDLSGRFDTTGNVAIYNNKNVSVPDSVLALNESDPNVLGLASEERWIEVDLSDQTLTAWEGNTVYLQTLISSGLQFTKTPVGEFHIWIKLRSTRMEGGEGAYYYNLPNVPYVMFFENDEIPGWRGFGLHGTYWHNDFGTPHSHGCVNLPTEMAGKLYDWTSPLVPEGKWQIRATEDNPGTRIVIHE